MRVEKLFMLLNMLVVLSLWTRFDVAVDHERERW